MEEKIRKILHTKLIPVFGGLDYESPDIEGYEDALHEIMQVINEAFEIREPKNYTDNLPTEKQLRKSANQYDGSAHGGHYAGEDPKYHWMAGAEYVLRKIKADCIKMVETKLK